MIYNDNKPNEYRVGKFYVNGYLIYRIRCVSCWRIVQRWLMGSVLRIIYRCIASYLVRKASFNTQQ